MENRLFSISRMARTGRGWTATVRDIGGDDDHVQLILARGRGLMMIVM